VFRVAIALTLASASMVEAAPQGHAGFWREILDPNADEVASIVAKAKEDFHIADEPPEQDPGGVQRARYYREALGMLRCARKLAPNNLVVLRSFAHAAERLGDTDQALDALETALRIGGVEHVGAGALADLGALYVRLDRIDDAIRVLRAAQSPLANDSDVAVALVHLANAFAARGQLTDAIDLLVTAMPAGPGQYYRYDVTLVGYALAVLYDRDDQPSAAFEIIDRLQAQLTTQLVPTLQSAFAQVDFAPVEDQHYYAALLYEVMGDYVEARAEWALYAAMGARYRGRALEHVAAIDALHGGSQKVQR
jgi:tetratricopeptide (TPR) repeat protein